MLFCITTPKARQTVAAFDTAAATETSMAGHPQHPEQYSLTTMSLGLKRGVAHIRWQSELTSIAAQQTELMVYAPFFSMIVDMESRQRKDDEAVSQTDEEVKWPTIGTRYSTSKRTELRLTRLSAGPLGCSCSCRGVCTCCTCCRVAIFPGSPLPKVVTCVSSLKSWLT